MDINYFIYSTPKGQCNHLSLLCGYISKELADFKEGRPTDFSNLQDFVEILDNPMFKISVIMRETSFPYEVFAKALCQEDIRPIRSYEDVAFEISLFRLMLQNIKTLEPSDLENTIDSFKKFKKQVFFFAD